MFWNAALGSGLLQVRREAEGSGTPAAAWKWKPLAWMGLVALGVSGTAGAQTWTCSPGKHAKADVPLTQASVATDVVAGWDLQRPPQTITAAGCSSADSFFFSVPVHEGNYVVTVQLGGAAAAVTTVKAEARRVMLARVATKAGQYRTESFLVNVREPAIAGGGEVRRKPREIGSLDWDDKLTLEFAGTMPAVRSLSVRPAAPGTPTLYIAGDSTATDQDLEPWSAWGGMLPAFFDAGLAVANHAESGETIRSFVGENRFAKIFSLIKPGDFLLMQFAHNDQKPGKGYVSPADYADLLRKYVAMAREKGATPVLVTSMNRRTFDAAGHITDTLAPYPETMRDVARETHTALIDLNSMSKTLYEAVGEAKSRSLFVYAAANTYPNQAEALHDDTHFNSYGAWELARCVVLGMKQDKLPLVKFLRPGMKAFDPQHPDSPESVAIPATPFVDAQKPYER